MKNQKNPLDILKSKLKGTEKQTPAPLAPASPAPVVKTGKGKDAPPAPVKTTEKGKPVKTTEKPAPPMKGSALERITLALKRDALPVASASTREVHETYGSVPSSAKYVLYRKTAEGFQQVATFNSLAEVPAASKLPTLPKGEKWSLEAVTEKGSK